MATLLKTFYVEAFCRLPNGAWNKDVLKSYRFQCPDRLEARRLFLEAFPEYKQTCLHRQMKLTTFSVPIE